LSGQSLRGKSMTWFGTIWPICRRRHLTLSSRFAIKCGECTARRKYESCSQRPPGRERQTSTQRLLQGSFAPAPSRGAGRLCPELYKSYERRPAALSGAFCGLSIESTTIVRREIGFERFRARGSGPALIARQPSRRTVANRHERSGRSTMSFDARQRDAAPDDAAWLAELNARATLTQQRLAELKAMLDEMRMERDAWRDQALRLALPAPAPSITLWRWLRSTG
jgi:hypothetical protein